MLHITFITIGLLLLPVCLSQSLQHSTSSLSQPRSQIACTSSESRVYCAAGLDGTTDSSAVDVYDATTKQFSTATLSSPRTAVSAASAGQFVLFAGGRNAQVPVSTVDILNVQSNQWYTTSLSSPRYWMAACSLRNNIILFAGGIGGGTQELGVVDIFSTITGNFTGATALSQPRSNLAATASADQSICFFAGGASGSTVWSVVDVYHYSGTWTTAQLSQARNNLAATTCGQLSFFGGGAAASGYSAVVDVYDSILNTWSTIAPLSVARYGLAAGCIGNGKVVFAGGQTGLSTFSNAIDIYDIATHSYLAAPPLLTVARSALGGVTLLGSVLFAGGQSSQGAAGVSAQVDILTACTPGSMLNVTSNACTPCPGGTFTAVAGMVSCTVCGTGTFAASGSTTCTACSSGFYCPTPGLPIQLPCPAGHYCPTSQMLTFLTCPSGSVSQPSSSTCSPCPAGSHASPNQTVCLPGSTLVCNPGSGLATPSAPTCTPCPAGHSSDGGPLATCRKCAASTYTNINGSSACLPCTSDPGLQCLDDVGLAVPKAGYWSYILPNDPTMALHTVACHNPSQCPGGFAPPSSRSSPFTPACDPSRDPSPTNVECAACAPGFSEWGGQCLACSRTNAGLVLLVLVLSWAYVLLIHTLSKGSGSLVSVVMYFIQVGVLITDQSPTSSTSPSSSTAWLHALTIQPHNVVGCLGPITPLGQAALALAMPFVLLAEIGVSALLHWALRSSFASSSSFTLKVPPFSIARYQRTMLALLLFSCSALASATIPLLVCVDIGPSYRVVATQPAIDCHSSGYQQLRGLLVVVLIAVVLLPVAVLLYLLRNRRRLMTSTVDKPQEPETVVVVGSGILYEPYHPDYFYWHVVILVRRIVYVAVVAAATTYSASPSSSSVGGLATALLSCGCILLQHFAQPFRAACSNRIEMLSVTLHAALSALSMLAVTDNNNTTVPSLLPATLLVLLLQVPACIFLGTLLLLELKKLVASSGNNNNNKATAVEMPHQQQQPQDDSV